MPPICPNPGALMACNELSANIPVDFNCSILLEAITTTDNSITVRYQGVYLPAKGKIVFTGRNCGSTVSSTVNMNYGCRCGKTVSVTKGPCNCDGCLLDETLMESIFYTCKEDLGNFTYRLSGLIRGMTTCGDGVGNALYRRDHPLGSEVLVGVRDCTWDYLMLNCFSSPSIQDCSDVTDCVNNCLLDPTTCIPNFCTAVNDCVVIPPGADICAQMLGRPYGGVGVGGVTEVMGTDCLRYTLPSASSTPVGFTSYVDAGKNGSVTIPYDTFVTVTGWTINTDTLGEFNSATGTFTAAAAGKYFFNLQLYWAPVSNTTGDHQAHLNPFAAGWKQGSSGTVTGSGTNRYSRVTAYFDLAAGGTVVVSGRVDFGNSTGGTIYGNLLGTNLTYLQVYRVA